MRILIAAKSQELIDDIVDNKHKSIVILPIEEYEDLVNKAYANQQPDTEISLGIMRYFLDSKLTIESLSPSGTKEDDDNSIFKSFSETNGIINEHRD